MKVISFVFLIFIFLINSKSIFAQECATIDLHTNSDIPVSIDFTFDNMSDYISGKTIAGKVQLKLIATELNGVPPPCKWSLKMRVENYFINPLDPPAATDWGASVYYNYAGPIPPPTPPAPPPIDLLWVRVYNACKTPIIDGFTQFGPLPGETLDEVTIIDDVAANVAGVCPPYDVQVNTAGTYMTNFNQFTFNVDFRVKPNLALNNRPGKYELKVYFKMVQQ